MGETRALETQRLRFEVGAGVILTLGRDLITDSVQAVMELVKNAYDADSSWVSVEINTSHQTDDPRCLDKQVQGFVRVADRGHGMTLDDVKRGWLTIAQSQKRRMKEEGRRTRKRQRTPLGDKGLGRLGSQALGRYVEILTRPEGGSEELAVWIDWAAFRQDTVLSEIEVQCSSRARDPNEPDGTAITIYGLHAPATWATTAAKKDLQGQLGRLISPFRGIQDFTINVVVDGAQLDLLDLGRDVRQAAATTFSFEFDGEILRMTGEARMNYCRPTPNGRVEREAMQAKFAAYVSSDGGEKLLQKLTQRAAARRSNDLELERSERPGWFVSGHSERLLAAIDKKELERGQPVSPGPFSGELDTFIFSGSELSVSGDLKELIRDFAGIRVYRDGFGIKLHDDWLGLAKHITTGGSYFELKLENTVGYIAITAEDNGQLVETADRQRFQEDAPAFKNFRLIMGEVVRFVGEFQELLRRGASQFLNEEAQKHAGVDPTEPTAKVGERLDRFVAEAKAEKEKAARGKKALQGVRERVRTRATARARTSKASPTLPFNDGLDDLLHDVDDAIEQAQEALSSVDALLSRADEVAELRNLLVERNDALHEQAVLLHETASLGISAEMVSHEIAQIADGMLSRATPLIRSLREAKASSKLIAFVEHVRTQAAALRRQASHVAPALRYVRERRSDLDVKAVVSGVAEYHRARLQRGRIALRVRSGSTEHFSVYMNQGKLTQVLDNLIINAEYWVAEKLRHGTNEEGFIQVTVDRPFIRLVDSGAGVDPAVEEMVFEQPFVTRKKEGRGLGLFISRRLLESDGCTISLAPERNGEGRRTTFEIDLSGAMHDRS
ncbi:MAG: sensor histidine kinase [Deltaproteobacteria bacterium]|nr:sensor histidine kinase [Deltaproteobacteria bacterium]